jgi:carboxylesterase
VDPTSLQDHSLIPQLSLNGTPTPHAPKALHLKAGTHGVLLFHGLSSSPLELQFLARGLQRAGYTVRVPIIAGYSYGLPTQAAVSVAGWLACAQAEFDRFQTECESVSLGGLCVGALIALHLAAMVGPQVASILSLSVGLYNDGWGTPWFTPLLGLARYLPFADRIGIEETYPFGLKDERMRAWVIRQMKALGASSAGASVLRVADLLRTQELRKLTRRSLHRIHCPTLLIHAKEDECAKPRSSFEVASKIGSSRVRCILLSNSYHMISIDQEKALVLSEMLQFLDSHATPAFGYAPAALNPVQPVPLRTETS